MQPQDILQVTYLLCVIKEWRRKITVGSITDVLIITFLSYQIEIDYSPSLWSSLLANVRCVTLQIHFIILRINSRGRFCLISLLYSLPAEHFRMGVHDIQRLFEAAILNKANDLTVKGRHIIPVLVQNCHREHIQQKHN